MPTYICHNCRARSQIQTRHNNAQQYIPKCPLCQSEFIEEVEDQRQIPFPPFQMIFGQVPIQSGQPVRLSELFQQMLEQTMFGGLADLGDYALDGNLDEIISRLPSNTHPASQDQLDKLQKYTYSGPQEECAICKDDLNDTVIKLPCKHIYHASCIQVWLKSSDTCPVCRSQLR